MNPIALSVFYLFTVLSPLALAWVGMRPARPFWDELATGAGMLAFAIILVEFVLSGRFKTVSRKIGMDVTMRFHQLIARSALVLAVIHPFIYQSPFNPSLPWDDSLTLKLDIGHLATGTIAWVLLPSLVLLSIGRNQLSYRYETWRLMHGLGALLIAALILHHALGMGRYSQDPLLAGLWVVLFLIALLSLAFVYVGKPLAQLRSPWVVEKVQSVGLKTWELTLKPVKHKGLTYEAGQFAWLNFGHSPFSLLENPFSISSAPASGSALRFIIKELGDFTKVIGKVRPGTTAYVDAPHGNLVVTDRPESGIALIAGGVGIAPLIGIFRQLHAEDDNRPKFLVYGNRVERQIVHREEIDMLAAKDGAEIVHVLSEPSESWAGRRGLVDADLIHDIFRADEMKSWLFVLCGPAAMMSVVEDTLLELGVPAKQILVERFDYD